MYLGTLHRYLTYLTYLSHSQKAFSSLVYKVGKVVDTHKQSHLGLVKKYLLHDDGIAGSDLGETRSVNRSIFQRRW